MDLTGKKILILTVRIRLLMQTLFLRTEALRRIKVLLYLTTLVQKCILHVSCVKFVYRRKSNIDFFRIYYPVKKCLDYSKVNRWWFSTQDAIFRVRDSVNLTKVRNRDKNIFVSNTIRYNPIKDPSNKQGLEYFLSYTFFFM